MKRKMSDRTFYAIMFLILCLLAFMSRGKAETTMYVIVDEGTTLNIRENPGGTVCACLYPGDEVNVLQFDDGWAQIDQGGEFSTGWVSLDFLSDTPSIEPYEMVVSSNGRVRVRSCPDGSKVDYVHNGDTVTVSAWCNGWAKIGKGWVDGSYLREIEQ